MSGITTAALISAGATAGVGAAGMFGLFGKPKQIQYNAPSFYNDPNVSATENSLLPYASSLMSGQGLPAAYSGLITPNSPEFQRMLASVTGQTLGAAQAQTASQGLGDSGVAASAAAGAVGSETAQLTWQDFLNSQSNQMNLMNLGISTMGNVGNLALNNQDQVNQFDLTNAENEAGVQGQNIALQNQAQSNWGNMMGSGISSLGNLAGMKMLSQNNNNGFDINSFSAGLFKQ
jgi:hypothetical protein